MQQRGGLVRKLYLGTVRADTGRFGAEGLRPPPQALFNFALLALP